MVPVQKNRKLPKLINNKKYKIRQNMPKKQFFSNWVLLILLVSAMAFWQAVFIPTTENATCVYFLDVGQGDSEYIRTKEGTNIVIDAGSDARVLNVLQKVMPMADKEIDLLVLTHPDKDHIGGIDDILSHYIVHEIWYNGDNDKSQIFKEVWNAMENEKKDGAEIIVPSKNQTKVFGQDLFSIVYQANNPDDDNANSLVAMFSEGEWDALFMADLTADYESQIVARDIEILKIGHHGSKNATTDWLLNNFKPETAVISVGKNSYGHPTPEVLDKLSDRNITIHRTDKEGTIKICNQ